MIEPEPLQQVNGTYVLWRGRRFSYFSGCDYFRLSSNLKIHRALTGGLKKYGLNVAASRLTTGNHALYVALEKQLCRFFGAESALLVSTGYISNLAVAQAISGHFSHALIDEAAHPSLVDAAGALGCPILKFSHGSVAAVETATRRCGEGARPVLLSDGLFARDGTVAPVRSYLSVLPKDAMVLIDDAHGAGVIGKNGKGTVEHEGISRRQVIQTITLSKAFGAFGGAILGSRGLRKQIAARSHAFIGSTPMPLPLAKAATAGLTLLSSDKHYRQRLRQKTAFVRQALISAGLPVPNTPGPIVSLQPKQPRALDVLRKSLLQAKIYPPLIVYPGAPASGYFRFVISSEHTQTQLQNLVTCLAAKAELLLPLDEQSH